MRTLLYLWIAVCFLAGCSEKDRIAVGDTAQADTTTLARQMGYPADARLLIVNSDDFGMCHAVTQGAIEAMEGGLVTSATLMVPCPWFPHVVRFAGSHPDAAIGVHLTLTAEWSSYRWGPVTPCSLVPSLLDPNGYFWESTREVENNATVEDAEREVRAQIDRALAFGIDVTHLDNHMATLYGIETLKPDGSGGRPDLLAMVMRVAKDYGLPFRLPYLPEALPAAAEYRRQGFAILDSLIYETGGVPVARKMAFYKDLIRGLKPGVTEIVIHCGQPTDELRAITSTWDERAADRDVFRSAEMQTFIEEQGITIVGYRALREWQRANMGWQPPAGKR